MSVSLEPRILERIAKEFLPSEQALVTELLAGYSGPEAGRIAWDILQLSRGNLADVRHYLEAAQTDYRDVLYWAEYYDTDPMFQGRDPRQMIDDIIEKWGEKK